uniref:Uncharacterized protein n=1 Tax=Tetranychus urticae TaxID=32264 RepID=T1KBN5_TETUR
MSCSVYSGACQQTIQLRHGVNIKL